MNDSRWQDSSQAFFDIRASSVIEFNDFSSLCYVSGRDPRLWSDDRIYGDMIASILTQVFVGDASTLLEVGCASGFLAWGLAPRLKQYIGVDVAPIAIEAARKLSLANADFRVADGTRLPFRDCAMDAAVCYDVFTNFPDFGIGESIIREMLRVVKPGGHILIGSVPDGSKREEYEKYVGIVAKDSESRFGPPPPAPPTPVPTLFNRFRHWLKPVEPKIICYYFNREDFLGLGERLGMAVELVDIHPLNPYRGYRFNAIFTKNGK